MATSCHNRVSVVKIKMDELIFKFGFISSTQKCLLVFRISSQNSLIFNNPETSIYRREINTGWKYKNIFFPKYSANFARQWKIHIHSLNHFATSDNVIWETGNGRE